MSGLSHHRPGPSNALLRIDDCDGELPKPFERPKKDLDFWVLELSPFEAENFEIWAKDTWKQLLAHEQTLHTQRQAGARLTLFMETTKADQVFRLEVSFVKILSRLHIALEHYQRE